MDTSKIICLLKEKDGLSKTLGFKFIDTPDDNVLVAKMEVNDTNKQIFGVLSGGATLALCETLAGVGSMIILPNTRPVGINVTGNHLHAMPLGGTVTAKGQIIHKGKTIHLWQIEVTDEKGTLISTVQVTNYIIYPKHL